MKKTLAITLILCAVAALGTSCGDDELPAPQNTNTGSTDNDVKKPSIVASSIHFDLSNRVLTFEASCPQGTWVQVLLRQLTNGTNQELLNVNYNSTSRLYYVNLPVLVGGSSYSYCIIGYDSEGGEAVRTAEQTFFIPKNSPPSAPSTANIKAYPPSSPNATDGYIKGTAITKAMEYSTDDGRTWVSVTVAGIISGLSPGDVLLRLAETSTTEAGEYSTITVPPYKSNTDLDGTDGTSEGLHVRRH